MTYTDTYTDWVFDDSTGESWEESIDYDYTVTEIVYTDPNNADSDFDFLPDRWELDFGFNPKNLSDGQADADLDGLSNGEEHLHGTDYLNPDSDWDDYFDGMEVLVMQSNPLDESDPEQVVEGENEGGLNEPTSQGAEDTPPSEQPEGQGNNGGDLETNQPPVLEGETGPPVGEATDSSTQLEDPSPGLEVAEGNLKIESQTIELSFVSKRKIETTTGGDSNDSEGTDEFQIGNESNFALRGTRRFLEGGEGESDFTDLTTNDVSAGIVWMNGENIPSQVDWLPANGGEIKSVGRTTSDYEEDDKDVICNGEVNKLEIRLINYGADGETPTPVTATTKVNFLRVRSDFIQLNSEGAMGWTVNTTADSQSVKLVTLEIVSGSSESSETLTVIAPLKINEITKESLLPVDLKVDYDRDGEDDILGDAGDTVPDGKFYRFWVNNDHDFGDDGLADDDPEQSSNITTVISCKRDLEDYVRMHVDLSAIQDEVKDGSVKVGFRFLNFSDGVPRIDLYPAADIENGSDDYLFDDGAADEQLGAGAERIASVSYNEDVWLAQEVFDKLNDEGHLHLIFDGANPGKGDFTMLLKWEGQDKVEGPKIPMQILDVRDMYEHWTAGDNTNTAIEDIPTTALKMPDSGSYDANSSEDDEAIVFIHGWRMLPEDRRSFADTSYKRLWHQGYNGRFYLFSWPTEHTDMEPISIDLPGDDEIPIDRDNYADSEEKAYHVGMRTLPPFLETLNQMYPGGVRMFAHSMGNIVASEALLTGATIHTYAACQSAVAAHAYDASLQPRTANWDTPEVYGDYPTTNTPYYSSIVGKVFNFHNDRDAALLGWEKGQNFKPNHGPLYTVLQNEINEEHYYCDDFDEAANTGQFYFDAGVLFPRRDLNFPDDRYEIFAHGAEARSIAGGRGAVLKFKGNFDLRRDFDHLSSNLGEGSEDHSGQFRGTNMIRHEFWNKLLSAPCFDFKTLRTKTTQSP